MPLLTRADRGPCGDVYAETAKRTTTGPILQLTGKLLSRRGHEVYDSRRRARSPRAAAAEREEEKRRRGEEEKRRRREENRGRSKAPALAVPLGRARGNNGGEELAEAGRTHLQAVAAISDLPQCRAGLAAALSMEIASTTGRRQ